MSLLDRTTMDSLASGIIAAAVSVPLLGMNAQTRFWGMNMNANLAVGLNVFVADRVSEWVKAPVLGAVNLDNPATEALLPPVITGLATVGMMKSTIGGNFVGPFLVGSLSSYYGPTLDNYIFGQAQ